MPRPTPIRVVHALVFAVALIVSILDLAEQFAGAPLAAALAVPVAARVIGMCREPSGRAGWRPILVAADIAIAVATSAQLFRRRLAAASGRRNL